VRRCEFCRRRAANGSTPNLAGQSITARSFAVESGLPASAWEKAEYAGAKTELFTIPGGGHGNFKPDERTKAYAKISEFLKANGL